MNKTIFFLILAVCILGMALILLNQRLGRAPEQRPAARTEQSVVTEIPDPATSLPAPGSTPAPSLTPPPSTTLPSVAEESPAAPGALPEAIEREAESEREAAAAAAAALAVEQKEATESLHGTPAPPAPVEDPAGATAGAPATPKTPASATQAPRPQAPAPAAAPAKKTTPASEKAGGPRTITRFVVFARDTGATVRLTGNGPLRYKSMNLENPDRVVIDLEGDWEVKAPAVPKNPLVSAVRVGDMDGRTRIVIDLKGKPRTARVIPAKTGDGVDVRVDQ